MSDGQNMRLANDLKEPFSETNQPCQILNDEKLEYIIRQLFPNKGVSTSRA